MVDRTEVKYLTEEDLIRLKIMSEDQIKVLLAEELRQVLHPMRNDVQSMKILALQVNGHESRLNKVEEVLEAHVKYYEQNSETLGEMLELMRTMKAGMKITNAIRHFILWLSGLTTAGSALYMAIWKK